MELAVIIAGAIFKLAGVGFEAYEASQEKKEELKLRVADIMRETKQKIDDLPGYVQQNNAQHDQALRDRFVAPHPDEGKTAVATATEVKETP